MAQILDHVALEGDDNEYYMTVDHMDDNTVKLTVTRKSSLYSSSRWDGVDQHTYHIPTEQWEQLHR